MYARECLLTFRTVPGRLGEALFSFDWTMLVLVTLDKELSLEDCATLVED